MDQSGLDFNTVKGRLLMKKTRHQDRQKDEFQSEKTAFAGKRRKGNVLYLQKGGTQIETLQS